MESSGRWRRWPASWKATRSTLPSSRPDGTRSRSPRSASCTPARNTRPRCGRSRTHSASTDVSFERTLARLEYELDVDGFTRGAQLAVERGGRRLLDVAMGEAGTGAPMERDTVFRVYCTIKPFTAIVVAGLVAEGRLDLDARLEPWLPDIGPLSNGVTLRHLLTHTAGVHRLRGVDLEFVPFARRRAAVASYRRPPGWRVGIDAGYSETMAWHLLGWLAE